MKAQKENNCFYHLVPTIISSIISFPTLFIETVEKQVDFFDKKDISGLIFVHYVSRRKLQL